MTTRQQSRQCEPLFALFRLLFGAKEPAPAGILPSHNDKVAFPQGPSPEHEPEKPSHSATATGFTKAGATALAAFKLALRVAKEASVPFPPLQAAVSGFLAVITELEVSDPCRFSHAVHAHVVWR